MQSETQLMLGISKGTEAGASGGSRTEKKESGAANGFFELFSGSLALSYENDSISANETKFADRAETAPEPKRVEAQVSERRSERYEAERPERAERNEHVDRRSEARAEKTDDSDQRPRNDSDVKAQPRNETSEPKQISHKQEVHKQAEGQARVEKQVETPAETKIKAETVEVAKESNKATKVEAATAQSSDVKQAVARSNAQARALANLQGNSQKADAEESVSKQIDQLIKTSAKVAQNTPTGRNQVQQNIAQANGPAPQAAEVAKNVATAKIAEAGAKQADANTARPSAVQAAEAPKNHANAQGGGEQQQSGNSNSAPNSANASPVAQEAVRLAQQHNRDFSATIKDIAQSQKVSKAGVSAQTNGTQAALTNAAGQYSKAATHVFNTPRAQAPAQAQPSQVISQLIRAAKISMQNGREEMKILLKPEDLGWLKVKITVEGNRVTAHFGAENEFVRGLLESNISQLQQALQNNNLKVNQIQIDVANQNQNQNAQSGAAGDGNGKNGHGNNSDAVDVHIEESTAEELYYLPDTAALELSAVDVMI